jgi:FK506-binding nuclear protein
MEDESANLDDMISKALKPEAATTNGEQKLSKKQAKKLKKNDGQAAAAAQEPTKKEQKGQKEAPSSDKKKVQFAEKLEQGPTGSPKVDEKKEAQKTGPRNVNGVTVDDKKIGKGRAAKKGDKIEMRYIGKLKSGKQFDGQYDATTRLVLC